MLISTQKPKENFVDIQFDNILRLFDVLPNFTFTTSELIADYYYISVPSRVAERLKNEVFRKLGNVMKVCKLHRKIP